MYKAYVLLSLSLIGLGGFFSESKKNGGHLLNSNKHYNDTLYFDKSLPVFKANKCLTNLLIAVIEANKQYYRPDKFFYSLTFKKGDHAKYLNISVGKWGASKSFDYSGVIKFDYAIFLCNGDFSIDSLFYKVKPDSVRIKLRRINDNSHMPFNIEPSLRGSYQECSGQQISLEIYTRGKIHGYNMKEQ